MNNEYWYFELFITEQKHIQQPQYNNFYNIETKLIDRNRVLATAEICHLHISNSLHVKISDNV